jgi:DNA invertase Pin-like site-specific DNA recombinase
MRVAIYTRVSTSQQTVENQRIELARYVQARNWTVVAEYRDEGVSGSSTHRPGLDALMEDARRQKFQAVCVAKLDRFGRSLKDLVLTLEELQSLGIAFVSLGEGLDFSSSVGRLQLHILAALAQWERERIVERIRAGIDRAKAQGRRFGRPRREVPEARLGPVRGLSVRDAAARLGVSPATAHRWLSQKGSSESNSSAAKLLGKEHRRTGDVASHQ